MSLPYSEIAYRDKILFELAMYEVQQGMMRVYSNEDELNDIKSRAIVVFNLYKRLIMCGEYSFTELVNYISNKYSANKTEDVKVNLDDPKGLEKMFAFCEREELNRENISLFDNILDALTTSQNKNIDVKSFSLEDLNVVPKNKKTKSGKKKSNDKDSSKQNQ